METSSLGATVRRSGELAVVDLVGEINRTADEVLSSSYGEASATGANVVLLNFSSVDYINSSGIAVIVGVLGRARADGKRVIACGLSEHYREIFAITRLSDFMTIFDSEEAAASGV